MQPPDLPTPSDDDWPSAPELAVATTPLKEDRGNSIFSATEVRNAKIIWPDADLIDEPDLMGGELDVDLDKGGTAASVPSRFGIFAVLCCLLPTGASSTFRRFCCFVMRILNKCTR
jgi:hypothetical protein